MTRLGIIASALACLLLGGCAGGGAPRGALFTKVITPHMTDFDRTRNDGRRCVLDAHRIKDVFTGSGVTVEWSESILQAATRDCGITTLTHADEELFSILFGAYERRRLIVYGD